MEKCNVTPIHKSGSFEDPGNFRPISVVPIIAKLLEKIVAYQLNSYFEKNGLLFDYQGAYRRGRSTEQLLLTAIDTIIHAIDNKAIACVAFLDLRKAFDSLDHVILLQRLNSLGVRDVELAWFTDYLSDRFQRVKFNGKYSDWGLVKGGIPQGSALGPLLFLVYMNEMSLYVKHGILLQFADDTAVICSGINYSDVQRQMCENLQLISCFISESKMKLNVKKCNVMWFKPKSVSDDESPPVFSIDDDVLKEVSNQKYLGIVFDSKLNWRDQISQVCKKMSYYLFWINSNRKSLSTTIIKMLINSLVISHLDYALPVWGPPLTQNQVDRLQRLQNWGIRIVYSLRKYDHVSKYRNNLSWLPIKNHIRYRCLCAMHHYHYSQDNVIPLDPPILFGSFHNHNTRHPTTYANTERCHLSSTQRYFRIQTIKWWNQLPNYLYINNYQEFTSTLHHHLLTDFKT